MLAFDGPVQGEVGCPLNDRKWRKVFRKAANFSSPQHRSL